MKKIDLLFGDKYQEIATNFIKDGWLTVYENNGLDREDSTLIYCCLVKRSYIKEYLSNTDWGITPGSEGKPCLSTTYKNEKPVERYETYSDKGIEPFLFSKHFSHEQGKEKYIDIGEEFVLYFKLYERAENKQNRIFYFIDDSGQLNEAIIIKPGLVKIRLRYLNEYLSVRKCSLAVCFDFMRFGKDEYETIKLIDQDFVGASHFYNHYIRESPLNIKGELQSWIRGKLLIRPPKAYSPHYDSKEKYADFLTGYDDLGNEVFEDCSKSIQKTFVTTYFRRGVLDKYYNEPTKYKVEGWEVRSEFFSLKIDNHNQNYVAVFLTELRMLPYNEQLHWKHYNFLPLERGISPIYHETMIQGNFVEGSGTLDLIFKERYQELARDWKIKFGWDIYKPLEGQNAHRFTSLHIPHANNIKTFSEQILALVIVTIDSLNEKELEKGLTLDKGDKGITKFQKFLESRELLVPNLFNFLRNLQDLRSGLMAHRFSQSSKTTMRAVSYFGLTDKNYIEVAKDIFGKSIQTLNLLRRHFLE